MSAKPGTPHMALIRQAYAVLAPIDQHWHGRHTEQGQRLLCELRDAIAEHCDMDPESVQDAFSVPVMVPR